ncbi:MAG: carbohydrate ABC transporter substrate-binding protein, partial [Burkholderiaceae bacterium]|nr:carbohydrate ABC transporter substrate-binding protein [Burkholderiaceae bacterium]
MRTPDEDPSADTTERRRFLGRSVAAGLVATAPTVFVRQAAAAERVLKLVHWKHFVPDYDKYFEAFAKDFGAKHNCR